MISSGGADILRDGIFETEGGAFRFPLVADTNLDSVKVGDDRALAFGGVRTSTSRHRQGQPVATNSLEIKKNQDSGPCDPCRVQEFMQDRVTNSCQDACLKLNIEEIQVGDRIATAIGQSSASNSIKIITNQV